MKNKLLIISAVLILAAAVCAALIFAPPRGMPLTVDQKKLVKAFGYPDVFSLTIAEGDRIEVWSYYKWQRTFTFSNGKFVEKKYLDPISSSFTWPKVRPNEFRNNMTEKEVRKLLGPPSVAGTINPELMENAVMYDYSDQIKVGIKNGMVVYVQTLPVPALK